jgi:hypothetical protein
MSFPAMALAKDDRFGVDCGPSTLAIRIHSSQGKLATVRAFRCESARGRSFHDDA